MKLAVAGKGGVGKTTLAGTLARGFATEGYDVVAFDDDDDPNLDVALGLAHDGTLEPLPEDLVVQTEDTDNRIPYRLSEGPEAVLEEYGQTSPDGVRLLQAGEVEAGAGCFGTHHVTVRMLVEQLTEDVADVTLVDLPNGVEHFGLGTAKPVDELLVVVDPSHNALETVPPSRKLAAELGIPEVRVVANKIRTDEEAAMVADYCADEGVEVAATVPYDDAVRRAERAGAAPVDHAGDGPAVRAIRELGEELAGG